MKAVSVEEQAQHIVDFLVDRMYYLVEMGGTESVKSIYCEIQEWIAEQENAYRNYSEVLSIEIHQS